MRYGLTLKKEKNIADNDPSSYGDIYTLTAIKTDTRLLISHHECDRSTNDAIMLFKDVEKGGPFLLQFLCSHPMIGMHLRKGLSISIEV